MEQGRGVTANQQVLGKAKEDLVRRFPSFGQRLIDFLERDQSRIVYAKDWGREEAAIRVFPSPTISNQFDISLEIPVLVADFPDLQPRTLRQFDTSVELRKSASADKDIAVLVASDARAQDLVRDRKRFAFPVLVIDASRLAEGGYTNTDLRTELARLLRSVDHFDYSNEITTAADFFGRRDEIEALTRLAVAGQSVGIFGLRRSGKTSLLYRVRGELKERGVGSIYVQLNALLDADAFRGEILRELDHLAADYGLKRPVRDPRVPVTAREWVYGIAEVLDLIDHQVVIIIDEIDLANEDAAEFDESEIKQRQDLNRVLQQLRGIIQIRNDRSNHRLSFLVAGVAMSVFTQAIRFGRENQLFGLRRRGR
ncbi:MAG: ATP-binding protein [Acidimicrobiaceae bacterium]|nr:ATP-binding protein [Acidimicrobiaceae bacterium]